MAFFFSFSFSFLSAASDRGGALTREQARTLVTEKVGERGGEGKSARQRPMQRMREF